MNVYDFDKTIFPVDSTAKFFTYCMKRYPAARRYLPRQAVAALRYGLKQITLQQFKAELYSFLPVLGDAGAVAKAFWDENIGGIEPWYLKQKKPDDLVISASPEFLIEEACIRLGILPAIASPVDALSGALTGENCKSEEKVRRFRELYPDAEVEEFYSDSLSDTPMALIAKKAYIVNKGRLSPWPR